MREACPPGVCTGAGTAVHEEDGLLQPVESLTPVCSGSRPPGPPCVPVAVQKWALAVV